MTDEPVDPVERRNQEDEQQVLELAAIDMELDDEVGRAWFGDDDDEWLDRRLDDA